MRSLYLFISQSVKCFKDFVVCLTSAAQIKGEKTLRVRFDKRHNLLMARLQSGGCDKARRGRGGDVREWSL